MLIIKCLHEEGVATRDYNRNAELNNKMDDALKLQLNKLLLSKVTSTDKIIGRGAYGKVNEVYVHGTLCAAKEIHPLLVENVSVEESKAISRSFCEECVIASQIHHPNVVQMLGIYY